MRRGRKNHAIVALFAGVLLVGCDSGPAIPWTEDRPQRVVITLDNVGWAAGRIPVVVPVERGPGNPDSIRVSEIGPDGVVVDAEAPFQFDRDGTGGEWTFMVGGDSESTTTRRYVVYFDDAGQYAPTPVGPRVVIHAGLEHEGQESVRIETGAGTWFYHLTGAGFASLVDSAGQDWLSYRPGGGAAGEYRGIPNLVYPEGYFHPGGSECSTRVVVGGPLRAVLDSECGEGAWAVRWEIFRLHARMTVRRVAHPYWFLYEGTPGGALDEHDYYVLADGTRFSAAEPRDGDLPEPEWLYFGDAASTRVLWLGHDRQDSHPDAYYPMDGQMTVFGFGRRRVRSFLTEVPTRFVVGLAPAADHTRIAGIVETALARPAVHLGPVQLHP